MPLSSSSSRSSLARAVGGEDPYAGVLEPGDGLLDGHADGDGQVEEGADGGPYGLGVVQVHGGVGEDDGLGAGGVRAPQHGAGVAGVADVGEYGDELRGRAARIVLERACRGTGRSRRGPAG